MTPGQSKTPTVRVLTDAQHDNIIRALKAAYASAQRTGGYYSAIIGGDGGHPALVVEYHLANPRTPRTKEQ